MGTLFKICYSVLPRSDTAARWSLVVYTGCLSESEGVNAQSVSVSQCRLLWYECDSCFGLVKDACT